MRRTLYDADHESFRGVVREFVEREVIPHQDRWEAERNIDRDTWLAAGKQGLLGIAIPESYGGGGLDDYRYRLVIVEELARVGAASLNSGFGLQDDIAAPYLIDLCTEKQGSRWLPGMVTGEIIAAIAMTEPGAGSDLQGIRTTAIRDGETWLVSGAKTFITNGINSDIVIVAARSDPDAGARGISLFVVERGMPGFSRGRKLDKLGLHAQDTAELFFDEVRLPASSLLGREGGGFVHLMERLPRERVSIAVQASTATRAAINLTVDHVKAREAFGKPLAALQNTQFELADMMTEIDCVDAYLDAAVLALNAGELSVVDAAKVKLKATEVQRDINDRCVQLFGGYGYMMEYPIARAFVDGRIQTIYGGASEIMRTIIGRDITGLR